MRISALFFSTVALISGSAWADNPTVWTIQNLTDQRLYMECISEVPHGLYSPMEFSFYARPKSTLSSEWTGWDNDGMGLNPGTWTCQVGVDRAHLKPVPTSFRTDWGENITLTLRKSGAGSFTLEKSS